MIPDVWGDAIIARVRSTSIVLDLLKRYERRHHYRRILFWRVRIWDETKLEHEARVAKLPVHFPRVSGS